jgi:hypothetical protein
VFFIGGIMGPDEEKVMGAEAPTTTTDSPPASPASSGTTTVKTRWPVGNFVVEDLPVITADGTSLTADQYEQAKKMATLCEVHLDVVEGA